jgi:two-component system response regulator VicR
MMQALRPPVEPGGSAKKILLIEDDRPIAEALMELLQSEGYHVWHAADAAGAEDLLDETRPDLVILDIMLPDTDGLVLCSELRSRWPAPIVLLSATQRRSDPIIGLRLGADDFIAKPFDTRELLARLEAVLRRSSAALRQKPDEPQVHRFGLLTIDVGRRSVTYDENPLHLTPTEFRLLATLASEPEKVFSREELATRVWGYESIGESRVVDVHIRRLRQKLDEGKVVDPTIVTLRGFGYKLSSSKS